MNMPKKTLTALKGSIKKWEDVRGRKEKDLGTFNCPLCAEFFDGDCTGCPVKEAGFEGCSGDESTYDAWCAHQEDEHGEEIYCEAFCDECHELAQAEVDFLTSLLPKGEGR